MRFATQLRLYRRHVPGCRFKSKGQYYVGCACPIWAVGEVEGRPYRRSLRLRDWAQAVRRVERIEADPREAERDEANLKSAIDKYLADCTARQLSDNTVLRYTKVLEPFLEFCVTQNRLDLQSLNVALLTEYRASRDLAASTQRVEIECLRAFCRFCMDQGWITGNPAKKVRPPRNTALPTLPFTQEEVSALLAACGQIDNANGPSAERARIRARALLLLLLYSGLRISDAGQLERSRITADGRLFLRTMKTGAPVYVRLPQSVLDSLAAIPRESERYFFWSGRGKLSSLLGSMRRTMECLGKLTSIDTHPHRFRDTFAVRLLEDGVPIRTVQILLGHSTVTTTERHYAPFMRSHQRLLDEAVAHLNF